MMRADTEDLLTRFTGMTREVLGNNLAGVYLHGSAAMGCFHPQRSDLDLLVVVENSISREKKLEFMRELVKLNEEAPAKGIELSIVRRECCNPFLYPTPYELHFSVMHLKWYQENPEDYAERMNGTDKDLAAHVTIIRHCGVVLYGAAIDDIFGEVCIRDYIDSIWNDVKEARNAITSEPVYLTLNLCRVLGYLKEGLILSKKSGAEWGLRSVPKRYHPWLRRAAACYESVQEMEIDENQAAEYAEYMLGEIEKYKQAAEYREFLQRAAEQLGLGALAGQPYRVTGGYLHKMFCLETAAGSYAVKLLNPAIMKRPDALDNYRRAEDIERILCEHNIPVAPAIEINGAKLHCLEGQYFYVFQWIEGKSLDWNEIKEEHCRIAGRLLAGIHKIQQRRQSCPRRILAVNWDQYIQQSKNACPELAAELIENRELLYLAQREYNAAVNSVPDLICISDGDMDSKNVLWVNENPVIIDLECLDYGNPFLEMFQLALSWAGGTICRLDFACIDGFLSAYQSEYGEISVDWNALSGIGFSWLDWLEYNVKRALWIECSDGEEQKLGICQAHDTIRRIAYYHSVRKELIEHLAAGAFLKGKAL